MLSLLNDHQNELIRILNDVCKDINISKARFRKKYPPSLASFLWHLFKVLPIPDEVLLKDRDLSQAIRKIHDFYGWKAKDTPITRGHCSGALYRTRSFMLLSADQRVGTKDRATRTVHIEHSVPVGQIFKLLPHHVHEFETPSELHNFIMRHSVTTALSYEEENNMKGTVPASRHSGFEKTGARADDYPFIRYRPLAQKHKDFVIYNGVSGDEINIDRFTYEDHMKTLISASILCGSTLPGLGIYDGDLFNRAAWFLK